MRKIRPTWLRALALMFLGLPIVTRWPISWIITDTESPLLALAWLAYAASISLIIIVDIGFREWLRLFSLASMLTIVTCLSGPIVRALASWIGFPAPDVSHGSVYYLILGATMLAVVPFSVYCVRCFSASGLLVGASSYGKLTRTLAKHTTLALRVIQHVMEVLVCLMTAWRETHPAIFMPRHRGDASKGIIERATNTIRWWKDAVVEWCLAWLMHSLEPVPFFCIEVERLSKTSAADKDE